MENYWLSQTIISFFRFPFICIPITELIAVYNPFFLMTTYLVIPYRNRFVQLADDLIGLATLLWTFFTC